MITKGEGKGRREGKMEEGGEIRSIGLRAQAYINHR